jgi:hypothetical protein
VNYAEQLLAGLSRFNTDLIVADVGCDPDKFAEIIQLMHTKSPIAMRAAWVMTTITDKYPHLILPHLSTLIEKIPIHDHPGTTRSVLRTLAQVDIPEQYQGVLFNYACDCIENSAIPVAIKVYGMQILYNISQYEPDLKPELILLIENYLDVNSAGFSSRGNKLLNKLRKETQKKHA